MKETAGDRVIQLPKVKILATGGTIAGSALLKTQMSEYEAGAIGIQALLDAVPQVKDYANKCIRGADMSNKQQ